MPLSNAERQRRHRQRIKERLAAKSAGVATTLADVLDDCRGHGMDDEIESIREQLIDIVGMLRAGGPYEGDDSSEAKKAGEALDRVLGELNPLAEWTYDRLTTALEDASDADWRAAYGKRRWVDIKGFSERLDKSSNKVIWYDAHLFLSLLRHKGLIT